MFSRLRFAIVPTILASWLLAAGSASASAVLEIRDDGGFFKKETIREANEIIREIKNDHKIDLFIQTFKDIPEDLKKEFEEVKKDRKKEAEFFDKWARERSSVAEVNGIYVLILRKGENHPGHLQIEVGEVTRKKAFTLPNRDDLRRLMIAKFDKKEYDEGLLDSVKYVRDTVNANLGKHKTGDKEQAHLPTGGNSGSTDTNEAGHSPAGYSLLGGIGGLLCLLLVVGLGIWLVIGVIRALTGMGRGGYGGGGGYGPGGYGGGGGFGGGGFMSGLVGGLFGAAAGSWLYDRFAHGGSSFGGGNEGARDYGAGSSQSGGATPEDTDYSGTGGDFGGDQGGNADGGGDFGGGGDNGGGDFGGGGGDFGGGGGDF